MTNPTILVFYLDRELLALPEIRDPYIQQVSRELERRDANIIAYFLPTDGEERIECINPSVVDKADMSKITKMVEDIAKTFAIDPPELSAE